jgi:hypothetical protein
MHRLSLLKSAGFVVTLNSFFSVRMLNLYQVIMVQYQQVVRVTVYHRVHWKFD